MMATNTMKTIRVSDGTEEWYEGLASDAGLKNFLNQYGIQYLVTKGTQVLRIRSFDALVNDNEYSIPLPQSKKRRVEITSPVTQESKPYNDLREDWDKALPRQFNIGASRAFSTSIMPKDFIKEFIRFVQSNKADGSRRELGSIVAKPGWGKTYAMTLLSKVIIACHGHDLEAQYSQEILDFVSDILSQKDRETLKLCVPLTITLNSSMTLQWKQILDYDYDNEIAKRLAYVYFADMKNNTFHDWISKQTSPDGWTCSIVLRNVNSFAKKVVMKGEPVLVLLVDEPDHKNGAGEVLASLAPTALNSCFDGVDCRVVLSSLEQKWLFKEKTNSGRPIIDLKLEPPTSQDFRDLLTSQLRKYLTHTHHVEDLKSAAQYIDTLAGGHWRTIARAFESVVRSGQLNLESLKESVGEAEPYVPNNWTREPIRTCGKLEEALAHSILGSTLIWMEPLYDGPAWDVIPCSVIQVSLGLLPHQYFVPMVPLLILRHLSGRTWKECQKLHIIWKSQPNSDRRSKYLLAMLEVGRLYQSSRVSDLISNSKLYEDFTAQFLLLQWDGRERIDAAVRRRWNMSAVSDENNIMLKIPGVEKPFMRGTYPGEQHYDENRDPYRVIDCIDLTNKAWKRSKAQTAEKYTPAENERPHLWLVPSSDAPKCEFDKRLHVFRDPICWTKNRAEEGIRVLSPDASTAIIKDCGNKFLTKNASINCDKLLAAGSVIKPAKGNPGFDSLIVLQQANGKWTFALIENKFETKKTGFAAVKSKLEQLTKYRGVLWKVNPSDGTPINTDTLHLPNDVVESDVVWVMLHDQGYTESVAKTELNEWATSAKDSDFSGHVLLTTSKNFFGPCFQKINLLQRKN